METGIRASHAYRFCPQSLSPRNTFKGCFSGCWVLPRGPRGQGHMSLGLASGSSWVTSNQLFQREVGRAVSLIPRRTYRWRRKGSTDEDPPGRPGSLRGRKQEIALPLFLGGTALATHWSCSACNPVCTQNRPTETGGRQFHAARARMRQRGHDFPAWGQQAEKMAPQSHM